MGTSASLISHMDDLPPDERIHPPDIEDENRLVLPAIQNRVSSAPSTRGEERLSRSMSAKYSDDFEPTSPPLTGAQSSRRQSRQAAVSRARKVSEIHKLPGIEPDDGDDVVEGDANDSMWSSDILLLP